ncbi:hypothetical protein ACLSU7_06065 [Bdellovibrio sp. HCB185ZH]|uniref:hypothetical protein n=1 Tax=Bdellovibrio sp. HCB185ZH TaxID=3394235 RepID=UPI0039A6CE79
MKTNHLYVLAFVTSWLLTGCSLDVNLLGSKSNMSSIGSNDGPTTTLPMGNFTLALNKSIGKGKFIDLSADASEVRSGLIDNAKNVTLMSNEKLLTFDVNGNETFRVNLPTATYKNWSAGTRPSMVRDSSGNFYVVSKVNPTTGGDQGLLKISADGTSIQKFDLTTAGGNFTLGGTDIALVNVNGVDEIHITPYVSSGNSSVEVYDLNGVYKAGRDYTVPGLQMYSIAQNPIDKKIYVTCNQPTKIYIFNQDGTPATPDVLDFTGTYMNIGEVNFDASGRLYLNSYKDLGTPSYVDYGISVYDVSTATPVLLRTLRSSAGHDAIYSFAVSPDGNSITGVNSDDPNDKYDELYELSGSSYQFSKLLNSRGDGAADFNTRGSFATFALDKDENLYIDDSRNKRVKVYSMAGVLKYTFSVDEPNITNWTEHFVAMTSEGKVLTGGYDWTYATSTWAKIYIQVRDKTGAQQSAAMIDLPTVAWMPKFMGIDSEDMLWFDDGQNYYRADLTGNVVETIAYSTNAASYGVGAFLIGQVSGDTLYFLNNDYTLWGMNVTTKATTQLMGSAQYTAAGIFAVFPFGSFQPISGGKFAVLAYNSTLTAKLYVVIDPSVNYSVVTKIESADQDAFTTSMIWTSAGLWSKGSYDRYFLWDLH